MNTAGRKPDPEIVDLAARHLRLVSTSPAIPARTDTDTVTPDRLAEPVGDSCYRCDQPLVERVELAVTHPNEPPRPSVALCARHRDRHASGAERIGWCERGAHHALGASYCEVHLGTIC